MVRRVRLIALGLGASGVLLLAACSPGPPAAGPAASAPPGGSTAQPTAV